MMERSPTERPRLSDDELIEQSLAIFEDLESPLDDATSRMIASQFHGGMSSQLYSLASSGHIGEDLLREIDRTYEEFKDQPAEQRKLGALAVYVADRMSRNDVEAKDGWSKLWLEAPDQNADLCPCCSEHISRNHRVGCPLGVDDEAQLTRVQELQKEWGNGWLHWAAYLGFRNAQELEQCADSFHSHFYGAFASIEDFTTQYEKLADAYIPQTYYIVEADELVYIYDR